jgi:glucose dehydrogenase
MWLPKPLYELLPYLYVLIGLAIVGGAARIAQRVWGSSFTFVLGLGIVVIGVAIWMKRRSARLDNASRATRQLELFGRPHTPP